MTIPRDLLNRAQAAAALAMAPLADRTSWSVLIDVGTRAERFWRGTHEFALDRYTELVGLATRAEVLRLREELAAVGCRLEAPQGASVPVHWHTTGSGEPLLLLNGWTASGLVWPSSWLRDLEQRYRVIRIDNRGTGWSRRAPAPFTIGDLAEDARAVLRRCGVASATVLGFSMGGMIAQELAHRHPDVVSSLVLVGTRPPTPAQVPADRAALAAAMQPPASGQSPAEHVRATWARLAAPGFAEEHPHVLDELVAQVMRRPTPQACMHAQVRAIAGWHGPRRCTRITAPTVVVHGTRDPLIPVGNGMRLARLIPHAEYVELPGVGHLVAHEAGDELVDVVARHTRGSSGGPSRTPAAQSGSVRQTRR